MGATLTSGRTCTPTPSCPEAPPCTPVLLTACRRRSLPWLPPPSRSRSSLHLPADVDLQVGGRRVRPLHCPPQVFLSASQLSRKKQQHTGSYRHHLHLLVSGVFPSFLFNHTSFGRLTLFSSIRLYYIPSSTLTLSMFTKYLISRLLCIH